MLGKRNFHIAADGKGKGRGPLKNHGDGTAQLLPAWGEPVETCAEKLDRPANFAARQALIETVKRRQETRFAAARWPDNGVHRAIEKGSGDPRDDGLTAEGDRDVMSQDGRRSVPHYR